MTQTFLMDRRTTQDHRQNAVVLQQPGQPLGSIDVPLPALTAVLALMRFAPLYQFGTLLNTALAAMRVEAITFT